MTYHIRNTEYECNNCDLIFIPFEKDLPCPHCGTLEQSRGESYGFIDTLVRSMKAHKRQFGTYKPPFWAKTTYSDYIQGIVYKAFDFAEADPNKGIEYMIEVFRVVASDEGNKDEDAKHIRKILTHVKERLDQH